MADLVFTTPTWINTIISEKMKGSIQDRINATNAAINEAKNKSNETIAELDRQSKEAIAQADRSSRESIAKEDRTSNESIAAERRKTDEKIATINAMANTSSSVIRTFPPLFISMNSKGNDSSNNSTPSSPSPLPPLALPAPKSTTKSAREKADGLFPSLEPTFKFNYAFHNVESASPVTSRATGTARELPQLINSNSKSSNLSYFLAVPAIGLAMGAGSKVAMKQFSENYMFGDVK